MFIRSVEVANKAKTVGVAADKRSVYGGYHLVVVQKKERRLVGKIINGVVAVVKECNHAL